MIISDFLDKIRLLFVSEKKPYLRLKSILGFYPHDTSLYQLALVHKSVAYRKQVGRKETKGEKRRRMAVEIVKFNTNSTSVSNRADGASVSSSQISRSSAGHHVNNERLEFLGDAMLGAIVADILYKHYSDKQEGFLTTLRSKIVCRSSLNKISHELGLDKLIRHAGAITTGHNSFMGGNAFEAFVGAIYLDRGYAYCYRFLEEQVFQKHVDIESMAKQDINFKSGLIEWCQKNQYSFDFKRKESREEGNNNTPVFHSIAFVEGISCGTGDGYSKKESDQNAARQALKRIKRDKELLMGIKNAKEEKV